MRGEKRAVSTVIYRFLFTWGYNRNQRRALTTILIHLPIDSATGILVPPLEVHTVTAILWIVTVIALHSEMWRRRPA